MSDIIKVITKTINAFPAFVGNLVIEPWVALTIIDCILNHIKDLPAENTHPPLNHSQNLTSHTSLY